MVTMRGVFLFALCAGPAMGCSNALMGNDYHISIHTMDLPSMTIGPLSMAWQLVTVPKGTKGVRSSEHGYVGFAANAPLVSALKQLAGGMNDAGLSCDPQALDSQYPKPQEGKDNINVGQLCRWVLEGFGSVAEVKEGLKLVNFVSPTPAIGMGLHFALRDATGASLVIEFIDGETRAHDDANDGSTGFGIMTNNPPFEWQLENVRHLQWKQQLARSSVAMPGSWYPDERFLRLHLVKSGMPAPSSYDEAMMQAIHTLNTVTVPMGTQIGTDGTGDHTQYGTVYDHKNKIIYWRTQVNQNLQRLRLSDVGIESGGVMKYLPAYSAKLPWYNDAAAALTPRQEGVVAL